MKVVVIPVMLLFISGIDPADAAVSISPSIAIVDTGGGGGGVSGGYVDGTDGPFCGRGHLKC
ncbi:hypothetical protein MCEMRE182_00859 [Candidatus Nanopelagicaceae bacterium]